MDILEQTIVTDEFAADLGGIDGLPARGNGYIAISEAEYGRFFLRNHKPSEKVQASYDRQKQFYEGLFREGDASLGMQRRAFANPPTENSLLFATKIIRPREDESGIRNDFGAILDPSKTCCNCSVLPAISNLRPLISVDHLLF